MFKERIAICSNSVLIILFTSPYNSYLPEEIPNLKTRNVVYLNSIHGRRRPYFGKLLSNTTNTFSLRLDN